MKKLNKHHSCPERKYAFAFTAPSQILVMLLSCARDVQFVRFPAVRCRTGYPVRFILYIYFFVCKWFMNRICMRHMSCVLLPKCEDETIVAALMRSNRVCGRAREFLIFFIFFVFFFLLLFRPPPIRFGERKHCDTRTHSHVTPPSICQYILSLRCWSIYVFVVARKVNFPQVDKRWFAFCISKWNNVTTELYIYVYECGTVNSKRLACGKWKETYTILHSSTHDSQVATNENKSFPKPYPCFGTIFFAFMRILFRMGLFDIFPSFLSVFFSLRIYTHTLHIEQITLTHLAQDSGVTFILN